MHKKILLLSSGEPGKELAIALKRLGQTVIAVDSYWGAPAMQITDGFEVNPDRHSNNSSNDDNQNFVSFVYEPIFNLQTKWIKIN